MCLLDFHCTNHALLLWLSVPPWAWYSWASPCCPNPFPSCISLAQLAVLLPLVNLRDLSVTFHIEGSLWTPSLWSVSSFLEIFPRSALCFLGVLKKYSKKMETTMWFRASETCSMVQSLLRVCPLLSGLLQWQGRTLNLLSLSRRGSGTYQILFIYTCRFRVPFEFWLLGNPKLKPRGP